MDRILLTSSLAILAVVGVGFYLTLHHDVGSPKVLGLAPAVTAPNATEPRESTSGGSLVTVQTAASAPATAAAAPSTSTTTQLSEASLMAELRALKGTAPPLTLRLAREGNERFPDSTDAPERTWYVVKSLTDLGRHDEAREEARKMRDAFPDNPFTADVVRHTLVHPPTPPAP